MLGLLLFAAISTGCVNAELASTLNEQYESSERQGWGGNFVDRRTEHLADYVIAKHVKPVVADVAEVIAKHAGRELEAVDTLAQVEASQPQPQQQQQQPYDVVDPDEEELVIAVCIGGSCRTHRILRREWPTFWRAQGGPSGTKFTFLGAAGRKFQKPVVVQYPVPVHSVLIQQQPQTTEYYYRTRGWSFRR